jgi:hypothetical protein
MATAVKDTSIPPERRAIENPIASIASNECPLKRSNNVSREKNDLLKEVIRIENAINIKNT